MCVKFYLSTSNSLRDMTRSQIYPSVGCWFLLPCEMLGANCEIWHGSLFTAATAPTGTMTLAVLYSAWARERRIYKKFSTFTLLGYPMRQRFSELGGPSNPIFGTVIGLSLVFPKFVFDFWYIAAVQKYGCPKMIWVIIWAKIWDIFPFVKKGGSMGQMSVDILWAQPGAPPMV